MWGRTSPPQRPDWRKKCSFVGPTTFPSRDWPTALPAPPSHPPNPRTCTKNLIKAGPLTPSSAKTQTAGLSVPFPCSSLSSACHRSPAPGHLNTQRRHHSKRGRIKQNMEVEMQLDDDIFFAELSKRISLLITDDDEADFAAAQFPASLPVPGFSMAPHVPQGASMLAPPAYTLFHHAASYGAATNNNSNGGGDIGRAWQQQQCGSKGTGVFIPRSTPGSAHSKRKGRNWSGGSKAAAHKARAAAQTEAAAVTKRRA